MRTHKDGYIQARKVEIWLSPDGLRKAKQVGLTLGRGIEREIAAELGIEIEGALRVRVLDERGHVRLESDWVRPTRG